MVYAVRHYTRYRYDRPVWQSMFEVRMHPRSEGAQRCFTFQLSVNPRARIFSYTDHFGNLIHHFDLPSHHNQVTIVSDALVSVEPPTNGTGMHESSWADLDRLLQTEDYWDMLTASRFARTSPELESVAQKLGAERRHGNGPLPLLRELNAAMHGYFEYSKDITSVDSPIEQALAARRGVCQDFAHIMIAIARNLGIPARYVSGYIYHDRDQGDRGASHAWVEAMLPETGWTGFDPTTNLMAGERHIRTAVGRDYADVPPTLGTMKASAFTELQVRVKVTPSAAVLPSDQEFAADEEWSQFLDNDKQAALVFAQQQQQQ